jgi:hypothetical protein
MPKAKPNPKAKLPQGQLRFLYLAEFNRCKGDSIKNVVRRLRNRGYEVAVIRHKTTVIIRRPSGSTFKQFRSDLAELVQPWIGSMVLSSTSGKFWLLDNKGNQPGVLQRIGSDAF